ncbi:MAG: Gfo/Idh/MocA family protein [Nitrospiraceae bacterium]
MRNTLGIGVIGMGWMGKVHSRSYRQVPDRFRDKGIEPRLVICADEVKSRAEEGKERFGFEHYTRDWRKVCAHPEVEVVNIAAPNSLHLEMVRAAADAAKHVFCEKPVGMNPEETAEIERLARAAGVLSFVGFNYRWAPLVQYAHQLIQEGKLGALTHYRGRFFTMYGSDPHGQLTWRFNSELSGMGALGDIMSHVIDMAHMLVAPIERVISSSNTFIRERPLPVPGAGTHFSIGKPGDPMGEVTNEDYVGALVKFANGALGTFESCRVIYGPKCEMAFDLNGTKGGLSWDFERLNELELYLPGSGINHDGFARIVAGPEHPYHGRFNPGAGLGIGYEDLKVIEAYQFLRSVVDGKQGVPGFAEALALAEVQAAMIRSWESGTWERVTPIPVG